jgi:hypothetical protein
MPLTVGPIMQAKIAQFVAYYRVFQHAGGYTRTPYPIERTSSHGWPIVANIPALKKD